MDLPGIIPNNSVEGIRDRVPHRESKDDNTGIISHPANLSNGRIQFPYMFEHTHTHHCIEHTIWKFKSTDIPHRQLRGNTLIFQCLLDKVDLRMNINAVQFRTMAGQLRQENPTTITYLQEPAELLIP